MKRHMAVYSGDWGCGNGGSSFGISGGGSKGEVGLSRESSVLKLVAREASPLDDELEEEVDSDDGSGRRRRA